MRYHHIALAALISSTSIFASELTGSINVYDAKGMINPIRQLLQKGKLVLVNEVPQTRRVSDEAKAVASNFKKTRDFFHEQFDRNSWDNKGADVNATVNLGSLIDLFGLRQNAAWIGNISTRTEESDVDLPPGIASRLENMQERFIFGKGKKTYLDGFEKALDVIAHEYTHAVIDTTAKLKYEGQSGALNEHLADVFGAIINHYYNRPVNPFLIGASVLRGDLADHFEALRDMEFPEKGMSKQPFNMSELELPKFKKYVVECSVKDEVETCVKCKATKANDNCGVHILSGIPNRMAVEVIKKTGWDTSAKLFYAVMTKSLNAKSDFAEYAKALKKECSKHGAAVCSAVEDGLELVGLK